MVIVPEPVELHEKPPEAPVGNALTRGFKAVFVEHRFPYAVAVMWYNALRAVGVRHKVVAVAGARMLVRRASWDERALRKIMVDCDYTRDGFEIGDKDTVVDVGANIGAFAVHAALAATSGRVICFEPSSHNFSLLVRNIRLNAQADHVTAVRAAVAGKPGHLRLYRASVGQLDTTVEGRLPGPISTEEVEALTLEQIFTTYEISRCDLLKLDCEGAEYDILFHTPAETLIKVRRIAMAYHATAEKRRRSNELVEFLVRQGFEIVEYSDFVGFDTGFIRAVRHH